MIDQGRFQDLNFVAWMIVACEVAFWVVIGLGLVTRYVLRLNKIGLFLLALTPVVDLILLVITSIDLYHGATATTPHAIAAVYIGVSLAFGKSMIKWADEYFQYYILKQGSKPAKRYGTEHAIHYFKSFLRHVLAFGIGAGLLAATIYLLDNPAQSEALSKVLKLWVIVLGIDFLIAVTYFIWPKNETAT